MNTKTMNAVFFFVMTVLLPLGDLLRIETLEVLIQSANQVLHTSIPFHLVALIGFGAIVVLLVNWLVVKALKWAINKANKRFGEEKVGTTILFLITFLPMIAKAIH